MVAISYYLVALFGYVVKAIPGIRHEVAVAAAVPTVVAAVGAAIWRLHRSLNGPA